jgi:glyoxylase-like metal-dependent hydrolase (beta-lactamase superfamily II)
VTPELPEYELFAIRYATRPGTRGEHFLGGDPHDAPMPLDYFVWVAVSAERAILIDTGFIASEAPRRDISHLCTPVEGLGVLGIKPDDVRDVIITHMHYDHAGGCGAFSNARFHLQEDEMSYATGKHMCLPRLNRSYPVENVIRMVRLVFAGRVSFHPHFANPLPGITLHRIGGHTPGMQCVRVHTKRGWVVVASDVSHFYENFEARRPFGSPLNLGEMLLGFEKLRELAGSTDLIVPGHDPLVMARYAAHDTQGLVVRLHEPPMRDSAPVDQTVTTGY